MVATRLSSACVTDIFSTQIEILTLMTPLHRSNIYLNYKTLEIILDTNEHSTCSWNRIISLPFPVYFETLLARHGQFWKPPNKNSSSFKTLSHFNRHQSEVWELRLCHVGSQTTIWQTFPATPDRCFLTQQMSSDTTDVFWRNRCLLAQQMFSEPTDVFWHDLVSISACITFHQADKSML